MFFVAIRAHTHRVFNVPLTGSPPCVWSKVIQVGAGPVEREMYVLQSAYMRITLPAELLRITSIRPAAFSLQPDRGHPSGARQTPRPHSRGHWTPPSHQPSPYLILNTYTFTHTHRHTLGSVTQHLRRQWPGTKRFRRTFTPVTRVLVKSKH